MITVFIPVFVAFLIFSVLRLGIAIKHRHRDTPIHDEYEKERLYRDIRILEREVYGHTFTALDGTPEIPTLVEEYYAKHEPRPMVDPPDPSTIQDDWQDYEYDGGALGGH